MNLGRLLRRESRENATLRALVDTMNEMDVAVRRRTIYEPTPISKLAESKFQPNVQHDAAEYFEHVIEQVIDCSHIFSYVKKTTVECDFCGNTQHYYYDNYVIRLEDDQLTTSRNMNEAINTWNRETNFHVSNTCDMCSDDGIKISSVFEEGPDVHVVLFPVIYGENWRKKTWTLEISETVTVEETNDTYSLYAVVVHAESMFLGGHYYAYVKKDGTWYNCNDGTITTVDSSFLRCFGLVHSPHMLFYAKNKSQSVGRPPAKRARLVESRAITEFEGKSITKGSRVVPKVANIVRKEKKIQRRTETIAAQTPQPIATTAPISTPTPPSTFEDQQEEHDVASSFSQMSISQETQSHQSQTMSASTPASEDDIGLSFSQMTVSQENQYKSPTESALDSSPDMSKPHVIRGANDGISIKPDIDSMIVVANSLDVFNIGNKITINMISKRSRPTQNIKVVKSSLPNPGYGGVWHEITIGNCNGGRLMMIFQLISGRFDSGGRRTNIKCLRKNYIRKILLRALRKLPSDCKTIRHGAGALSFPTKKKMYVYGEDWELFAKEVNILMAGTRSRPRVGTIHPLDTRNVHYYVAIHGAIIENFGVADAMLKSIVNSTQHPGITSIELHVGISMKPNDKGAIYTDLTKATSYFKLSQTRKATPSFLNKYGHFWGTIKWPQYEKVIYIQTYDPLAHLYKKQTNCCMSTFVTCRGLTKVRFRELKHCRRETCVLVDSVDYVLKLLEDGVHQRFETVESFPSFEAYEARYSSREVFEQCASDFFNELIRNELFVRFDEENWRAHLKQQRFDRVIKELKKYSKLAKHDEDSKDSLKYDESFSVIPTTDEALYLKAEWNKLMYFLHGSMSKGKRIHYKLLKVLFTNGTLVRSVGSGGTVEFKDTRAALESYERRHGDIEPVIYTSRHLRRYVKLITEVLRHSAIYGSSLWREEVCRFLTLAHSLYARRFRGVNAEARIGKCENAFKKSSVMSVKTKNARISIDGIVFPAKIAESMLHPQSEIGQMILSSIAIDNEILYSQDFKLYLTNHIKEHYEIYPWALTNGQDRIKSACRWFKVYQGDNIAAAISEHEREYRHASVRRIRNLKSGRFTRRKMRPQNVMTQTSQQIQTYPSVDSVVEEMERTNSLSSVDNAAGENFIEKTKSVANGIKHLRPIAKILNGILRNEEFASILGEIKSVRGLESGEIQINLKTSDLRRITAKCEMMKKWKSCDYRRIRIFIARHTKQVIRLLEYLELHTLDDETATEQLEDVWRRAVTGEVATSIEETTHEPLHRGVKQRSEEQQQKTTVHDVRQYVRRRRGQQEAEGAEPTVQKRMLYSNEENEAATVECAKILSKDRTITRTQLISQVMKNSTILKAKRRTFSSIQSALKKLVGNPKYKDQLEHWLEGIIPVEVFKEKINVIRK